jgi:nucleotide-binding universal stress UspA family protein
MVTVARKVQQCLRVITMNIRNILVPVDFSPPSRLAVNYGVSLARRLRAKLTLMHVVESTPAAEAFSKVTVTVEKQHREQAVRMLSALVVSEDQDDLDLRIVIRVGDIKDEIAAVIREERADILVMGTHGRGLFGRWIIGSITESILRKTSIPVLTVCRATRPLELNRILFATDLSQSAKQGFDFALELAGRLRSEMVILHAIDQSGLTYGGPEMAAYCSEHDLEQAKAKLAALAAEGATEKVKIETALVEGLAAEEILNTAEKVDADIILIAVHKKGLIERALLGTTAERVIREANVPVLSIPASPGTGAEQLTEAHSIKE